MRWCERLRSIWTESNACPPRRLKDISKKTFWLKRWSPNMKNSSKCYKKKILIVVPSLAGGGAERVAIHLANYLDKDSHNIFLVLFEAKNDYINHLSPKVTIRYLNKTNRWDFLKIILRLKDTLRAIKPDAVISFLSYANYVTVLASMFLKKRRFNIIITEHNDLRQYLPKAPFSFLKKRLMKFTYNRADKVVSVSKKIKEILIEELDIMPAKVTTIYNPISLDTIASSVQEEIKHPFLNNNDAQLIVSVGRLVQQKKV